MARIFRQPRNLISFTVIFGLIIFLALSAFRVRAVTFSLLVDTDTDTVAVDGSCSLREAIIVVNSGIGSADCPIVGTPDLTVDDFEIRFDTGPLTALGNTPTIQLDTELPTITSTLDIRGFNTVQDLTHRVTLTPAIPGTVATGLSFEQDGGNPAINADNSGVFGLTFDGFGIGIQVNDVGGVQIGRDGGTTAGLRNYLINGQYGIDVLGTDADGTIIGNNSIGIDEAGLPAGNDFDGIWVRAGAENTIIGGANPDFGNIIGSNGRHGVNVADIDTIDITNNVIGLLSTVSSLPRGNGQRGIDVTLSTGVNIESNTIGFNSLGGIRVSNAPNTTFISNSIGVLPGTTTNVGNPNIGVLILSSDNSQFSGTGSAVAYSGMSGIVIQNSAGVAIRDTLTFSNAILGIDLGNNGVTPNDAGDGDAGANNSQNFPEFSLVATNGAVTGTALSINGQIPSGAGSYQLIFYVNSACDASGFGEGNAFLLDGGSPYSLSTTSGEFSALLTGTYNVGEFITAIAISPTGDTSEFAECIEITDDVLIASFVPSATTIVAGQSVFFDNTSTGVITTTRWFINGALVSNVYDLLQIFNTPGSYSVELEVENNLGATDRTAPVIITVLAPTSTPIPTPLPTLPPPNTPVNTSVPPVDTAIPTATELPSETATIVPSATLVPSATATTIPSATATLVPSATATTIPSATATDVPSATATTIPSATATLVPSETATTVPSATMAITDTATPALEVTVEGLGADSMSIVVVNSGLTAAQNLLVQEQLRSGVEYRAANLGEPICTEVGGLVSCRLGSLEAGQSANVNITVQTNGQSPDSGVTIVSADGVVPQIIDEPYIIKVGNPPVAPPGSEITYTIRVINPTDETATDMVIQDVMPDIIEILDASATDGDLEIEGQNITLSLDELGAGERVTLTIDARVSDDDEAVEAIINTACVTSSSNPSPNCAVMSFLAVDVLPNTGQTTWLMVILRWSIVLGISTLMLMGIIMLYLRLKKPR